MHRTINNAVVTRRLEATNLVLNATPTGSASTSVLRFNAAASLLGNVTEETDAAQGTVVVVSDPGLYSVSFRASFGGAGNALDFGINFNAETVGGEPYTFDPQFLAFGCIASAHVQGTAGAGELFSVSLTETFMVSAAAAATQFATVATPGATIRFTASNQAGAAPVGITATSAQYWIRKLTNVSF